MPTSRKTLKTVKKNVEESPKATSSLADEVLYLKALKAYEAGKPIITDRQFDQLEERLREGNSKILKVGTTPTTVKKQTLPSTMGSLTKVTDTKSLSDWLNKYRKPVVAMEKLDGVSILIDGRKGLQVYTRGDGKTGMNVSHLANILKPVLGGNPKGLIIRGELIAPAAEAGYANPRNMIAGLLNRKDVNPILAKTSFFAFEIANSPLKKSDQLKQLKNLGFKVPRHRILIGSGVIQSAAIEGLLSKVRNSAKFAVDGLVIAIDDPSVKGFDGTTINPKGMRAFKEGIGSRQDTEVIRVEWTASKDAYLKPLVYFKPIEIDGVKISKATGFNAKFIKDKLIGPGAKITVSRAGDVIPYIETVTFAAKKPSLPPGEGKEWEWSKNKVDIISLTADTSLRKALHFVETLGIDGLSTSTIQKLKALDDQYVTPLGILSLDVKTVQQLPGFAKPSALKLVQTIQSVEPTLAQFMAASGIFGRLIGRTKLEKIFRSIVDLSNVTVGQVEQVPGFSEASAAQIVKALPAFKKLLREAQNLKHFRLKQAREGGPLAQRFFVFTGFRSSDLADRIELLGGVVINSVTKQATDLVMKDKGIQSDKKTKARQLGIAIMSEDELVTLLNKTELKKR